MIRTGRPFTGGIWNEHITCSVGHITKVKQYENLEVKKTAARANKGTISDKEAIELKVLLISQVSLGNFFIRNYKKKDSLKVASQKEDTNQTESRNNTETNTSIIPTKKKTKVQSCEGIKFIDNPEHKTSLGLYTDCGALFTPTKFMLDFYGY